MLHVSPLCSQDFGPAVVASVSSPAVPIHAEYMSQLVNGIFLPETRSDPLAMVERLKARDGIECLVLGGTELPLILRRDDYAGVQFLDTTKLHADAIVSRLLL
jgi:aspartate racemase